MDTLEFLVRVAVGTGLAALLGLEREVSGKAAGLRTHGLVGLGAAAFTALSIEAFDAPDPSRVAAQIVSGIGFLGAGAIFRSGALVKGLTTAAGLWAAAAVGMAAGSGNELWATTAIGVALAVLLIMRWLKSIVDRLRTGVPFHVTVSPADEFMDVREQLTLIDPTVELEGADYSGDSIVLHFLVAPGRFDLLTNAAQAMRHVAAVS